MRSCVHTLRREVKLLKIENYSIEFIRFLIDKQADAFLYDASLRRSQRSAPHVSRRSTLEDYRTQNGSVLHFLPPTAGVATSSCSSSIHVTVQKTVALELHPSHTVRHVRAVLQGTEGISVAEQRLYFASRHLTDSCTLAYYLIDEDHTLPLCPRCDRIFVKIFNGDTVECDVDPSSDHRRTQGYSSSRSSRGVQHY